MIAAVAKMSCLFYQVEYYQQHSQA